MPGPDLPAARGEVSELLFDTLQLSPRRLDAISLARNHDSLADEDLQLALYFVPMRQVT